MRPRFDFHIFVHTIASTSPEGETAMIRTETGLTVVAIMLVLLIMLALGS